MNYFNKKNIAVIAIIILLIVNISTISTIIYLRYKKPVSDRRYATERSYRELRKEMRLNTRQKRMFREQGLKYKERLRAIHYESNNIRKQILDELSKSEPDTTILFNLTEKSGELHVKLKKNTIKHLMELKKTWNPEQYEMLDKVFRHAISSDEQSGPKQGQRKFRNRTSRDSMGNANQRRRI